MKTIVKKSVFVVMMALLAVMAFALPGCSKEDEGSATSSATTSEQKALLDYTYPSEATEDSGCVQSLVPGELSEAEREALIQMREEEYLAHDVYLALSQLYSKPIFRNIAKSELVHTNAVKFLIQKYNIPDPAANHVTGVFVNEELQALYHSLVQAGSSSLMNGLVTGATIEDLDIADLQDLLTGIDNPDIILVFSNLMKGSRNHLRSFYANIVALGGSYSPQFITPELFAAIIGSPHETGPVGPPWNQ